MQRAGSISLSDVRLWGVRNDVQNENRSSQFLAAAFGSNYNQRGGGGGIPMWLQHVADFIAIPSALLVLWQNGDNRSLLRSLNNLRQRTTSAPVRSQVGPERRQTRSWAIVGCARQSNELLQRNVHCLIKRWFPPPPPSSLQYEPRGEETFFSRRQAAGDISPRLLPCRTQQSVKVRARKLRP